MAELPRGTVTLVFTDIEGSTLLLAALGSRYEEVLAAHRRLVHESFLSHGGIKVDTQGDAFFYSFARAQDAVAGAPGTGRHKDLASGPRSLRVDVGSGKRVPQRSAVH